MAAVQLGIPGGQRGCQHAAEQARRGLQHRHWQVLLARRGRHFQADEAAAYDHHRALLLGAELQACGDLLGVVTVAQGQHAWCIGARQ